jgi:hypothetical protein
LRRTRSPHSAQSVAQNETGAPQPGQVTPALSNPVVVAISGQWPQAAGYRMRAVSACARA